MLVGLRIISILYDLFLASILFYRPFSKINMKKKPLIALFFILIFHGELVFLFSESRVFLVSNLLLNILEYYLIGLNFDYPIRQSSFWILLQTSLSLLAGAVLNQGIQLILPLGELSKNLEAISLYLGISFFLSTGITLILRKLLLSHQRLRIATSKGNWLYQFIVPLLSIFFAFTISAIQGGVFGADYLSIISLSSLIVLTLSSLYFNLYLARQQQQYYQNQQNHLLQ